MLGAYIFTLFISSSWIDLLIIMYCPSLSLMILLILKSILSEIRIATLAFFWLPFTWNIFFHPFTLSLYVSPGLNQVSCSQQIYGSCFCIHSVSLYLLAAAFNLFTFKVIIDTQVPIGIFLIVLGLFLQVFSFSCIYWLCKSPQYLLQGWFGGTKFS